MKHEQELERISGLTQEEAVMNNFNELKKNCHKILQYLLKKRKRSERKVDKTAKELLATTVQRLAADHTTESTVSVVNLP